MRRGRERGWDVVGVVRERGADAPPGTLAMRELLEEPASLDATDVLVHAAAVRHRHGVDTAAYRASNVELVERLLRASAGRVGRFAFVSSVGVYGFPERLPIDEAFPPAPRTLYSETKVEAERLVRRVATELSLPFTIIRPTIIYGPGDDNGMLDKLAAMIRAGRYRVVGPGTNTLHHTHVDDVVRGIFHLATTPAGAGEDFIVAGPETITLGRLGELVARAVGGRVPRLHVPLRLARAVAGGVDLLTATGLAFTTREPPVNNEKLDVMTVPIAFDASKARRAGFEATVRYEEGIAMTLGAR